MRAPGRARRPRHRLLALALARERQERAGVPRVRARAPRRSAARLHAPLRPADPPPRRRHRPRPRRRARAVARRRDRRRRGAAAGRRASLFNAETVRPSSPGSRCAACPRRASRPSGSSNIVMLGASPPCSASRRSSDVQDAAVGAARAEGSTPTPIRAAVRRGYAWPAEGSGRTLHEPGGGGASRAEAPQPHTGGWRTGVKPSVELSTAASTACSAGSTAPTRRSSSTAPPSPASTSTTARAARSARRSARSTRSRWSPRRRVPSGVPCVSSAPHRRRGGRARDAADRPGRGAGLPDHAADADHPALRGVRRGRAARTPSSSTSSPSTRR